MRAITPVFSVLLILVLSVALVGFLWLFVSGTFSSLKSTGTSTVNESLVTISSCMKIESVSGNQVSIRNCGKGSITQGTLSAYLDDIPLNVTMSSGVINEDDTGTISLSGLWNFNAGGHTLRIANPRVVTEAPVNAVLPDSTVMDLEFDEGQGNIAHDSSGNGNDGTLGDGTCNPGSGTCPNWVDGKFGKALGFDGTNDTMNISNPGNLNSLNNSFTLEAWIKPYTANHEGFNRIIWFNNFRIDFAFTNQVNGFAVVWFIPNSTWLPGSTPLALGQWYHVAATFSANSGNVDIYVNGKNDGEYNVGHQSVTTLSGNIDIGNDNQLNRTFNGTIDSVRIFNQALTPDQTISLRIVSYD